MPPKNHPETQFRKQFRTEAHKRGMIVVPIPDPKGSYQYQEKRGFDFTLITKHNTFCIEAKVGDNPLLPHQKGTAEAIEKVNPNSYWIIRKKSLKAGNFYYVEKFRNNKTERIVTSSKISDIVDHFERVRGWGKAEFVNEKSSTFYNGK